MFQNSPALKKVRSNTKTGGFTTFPSSAVLHAFIYSYRSEKQKPPEQIFLLLFVLRRELPASLHNRGRSNLIKVAGSGEAPWPAISYSATTAWIRFQQ